MHASDTVDPQRIMMVDDDDFIRETMEIVLSRRGHIVRATASGGEALRWLEEAPCDLLLVDFKMPGMDGPSLCREVQTRWPATRIVFVSGHGEAGGDHHDDDISAVPFLFKPFSLEALYAAVDRAMATV
jgi:DNA-binding NtrC family response regulator